MNGQSRAAPGLKKEIVAYTTVIGALSSLGSFLLAVTGWGGFGSQALNWFQLIPLAVFLLAFSVIAIDYEMSRDKWPERSKELARSVFTTSAIGPENTSKPKRRAVAEVHKMYYRMALADDKKDLAESLKKDIDRWLDGIDQTSD